MAKITVEAPDGYMPKITRLLRGFKKATVTVEEESIEAEKSEKKKKK